MKRILLIDGDVVAYRNAAAVEGRKIKVTHIKSGRTKDFNNRTAFYAFLKEKNFVYNESDYLIEDVQEPGELHVVYAIIDRFMEKVIDFTWADEYEIWLGKTGNTFRHDLPLPDPYKATRGSLIKPVNLPQVKNFIVRKFNAQQSPGHLETDDVLTIRCYEELAKGNAPIMVTIDKDANQTQGVAVLNIYEEPWSIEEIPVVGNLYKQKTTWKGNGLKFLAFQTLSGDATDTYFPYKYSRANYGPAKAVAALDPCTSEKEILEAVIKEYKEVLYPDTYEYTSHNGVLVKADWKIMLDFFWKCAYMKRSWDDRSDFWEFAKERGIDKRAF